MSEHADVIPHSPVGHPLALPVPVPVPEQPLAHAPQPTEPVVEQQPVEQPLVQEQPLEQPVEQPVEQPAEPQAEDVKPEVADIVPDQADLQEQESVAEQPPQDATLLKEQIKWIVQLTRNIKKKKDAVLFLHPVDPIALNVPTYFSIIKHPMDISTIEKKIQGQLYIGVDQIKQDYDLMFNNCLTFNGQVSPVAIMCKNLQAHFEREWLKMPTTVKLSQDKKRKSLLGLEFDRPSRPSRESLGVKRRSLSGKALIEQKFCSYVVRELCRKQHSSYNSPFLFPVDPIALGIPHYRDIVTSPMDLSTIRRKVDLGEYDTLDDFEADVRLMFSNCYAFNAPGNDVFNMGNQLEAAFNTKWTEKTTFISQYGESIRPRTKTYNEGDTSSDDDDGNFY